MKCDNIRELLSAYIDDELSEKESTMVRHHLEDCLDCKEEAVELNKVRQMMKELPMVKAPGELVDRINKGLDGISQPKHVNIFTRYQWIIPSLATAAAAFLVVYVGLILQPSKTTEITDNQAGNAVPEHTLLPANSLAEYEKAQPEGFTWSVNDKTDKPVVFSQKVNIASKNNDKALQDIKAILTHYSGKIADGKAGKKSETQKASNNILTKGKSDTERQKSKLKTYQVKVILPLNQKEAFIEQLKIQKIGDVKVADLEKAQTGSLTVHELLTDELVTKVEDKLNNKMLETKTDVEDSYGCLAKEDNKTGPNKQEKSNRGNFAGAMKTQPAPTAPTQPQEGNSFFEETESNLKKLPDNTDQEFEDADNEEKSDEVNELKDNAEQLKKIDDSLVILHDLESQKQVKEKGSDKSRGFSTGENKELSKDRGASDFGLIELIIILDEE
ncbi:MAG: zf-HC2 domain-containing protein [Planctomycetes bacterium]|nr:zf-HC2 domain-containing protein [Planctomycetota bacterium]